MIAGGAVKPLDVAAVRAAFPILSRMIHGKRLVYLDSAATAQKPRAVIDALTAFYSTSNANIHRGVHTLAEEATGLYEQVRKKTAEFIGLPDEHGVVFTRNATEAINLVAFAWARQALKAGDEIVITSAEHHANFVPWIEVAKATGATLKTVKLTADGTLNLNDWEGVFTPRTRLAAFAHASNVLGTIHPVAEMAKIAHRNGALVLVDAAQSVPHLPVNMKALGADLIAFSAHKMLGPTGVGVLAGDPAMLSTWGPFNTGGSMIREVKPDKATWNDVPWRFEAGTPDIGGVIAFGAALDYLNALGMDSIRHHEIDLTKYALEKLQALPSLTLHGPLDATKRTGVISFVDADLHPHDLATVLDREGIAIRAGHHCAQPLMRELNAVATARASFYIYNDRDDVDALIDGLKTARKYFKLT